MLEMVRRPEKLRWQGWITHQTTKVTRALDQFEAEAATLSGPLTIGHITAGCAFGYLDFRAPETDWRDGRPKLAAWYENFTQRPALRETVPQAPK
jgi:glutathione S-transferase